LLQVESQLAALRTAVEERDSAVRTQLHQSQSALAAAVALKLDERSTRDVVAQMLSSFHAHFVPASHSTQPAAPPTVTLLDVDVPPSPQQATSLPHAAITTPTGIPSSPSMELEPAPSAAVVSSHSPPAPPVSNDAGSAEARAVAQRMGAMESVVSTLQAELEHQSTAYQHGVAELTQRVQELRQELAQTSTARDVRQVATALKELSRQLLSASPSDGVTTVAAAASQMVLGSRVGELWRCLSCDQAPRSVSDHEGVPLTAPGLRGGPHRHHLRQRSGSPPRSSSRSASPLREVRGRATCSVQQEALQSSSPSHSRIQPPACLR
jgi:hypothetical protein